ncbi:NAD-dependent epimerase/dehydratase family protein, partial [bacterium]|nr:NAD-dependent epimerase/dehydratase family protein [bacterium]
MEQRAYVVVTGAHGFIGNHILEKMLTADIEELKQAPDFGGVNSEKPRTAQVRFSQQTHVPQSSLDVWAVDLPESANRATAHRFAQSSRVKIVFLKDLMKELQAASHPPLAVIHNGACSSTVETNPAVFAELNMASSQDLWNYCAEHNIPFIYASSAAVYGDGLKGFSDAAGSASGYTPLNLYGHSKLDFDLWAMAQSNAPSFWFGLRYFNVYGPFEGHKGGQASMVFHGYQQATRTGAIRLFKSNTARYGDGDQLRDFVYVKDITRVTMHLLKLALSQHLPPTAQNLLSGKSRGCFLNVGTGEARSWNHLAGAVFDAIAVPRKIEYIDIPGNIAGQYQNYTCADISNLRAL